MKRALNENKNSLLAGKKDLQGAGLEGIQLFF
jgi:hypothetical protein